MPSDEYVYKWVGKYKARPGADPLPIEERFWPKVDKRENGCWIWTGNKNNQGYGMFYVGRKENGNPKNALAHRFSYELAGGKIIPPGMMIDHLCRTPACVNPAHLEAVTPKENTQRSIAATPFHPSALRNKAKTHCPRGHEYNEENTAFNRRGQRSCRECKTILARKYRSRNLEAWKSMTVPTLLDFGKSQLQLIKQTCAKECNDSEFSLFIEMCKARGLNPLLRHIYAMVVHKDDAKKRQLVLIVSIDGQRVIAERTKNYRPDEQAPRYEIDPDIKGDLNPAGLISAAVSVYIHRHGDWHPVPAVSYWDEFAPYEQEWAEDPSTGKRRPTGKMLLKGTWKKMPRVMLAKVAEMQALRKAFPDDYGGLYGEEEIDRTITIDLTASQVLEEAQREQRMELIGGPGVMIDWMSGGPLDKVSLGQLHDRAVEFVRGAAGSPGTIKAWEDRNRHALRDLWAYSSGDGMDLKEEIEKAKAKVVEIDPEPIEQPHKPRPKKMKIREKARLDEAVASLPSLRLSAHKAKKP